MNSHQRRGRRLAFDFGDVRIGVAVCDPDAILATPLPFIRSNSPRRNQEILSLINEYEPVLFYVGLPAHMSGELGAASEKVELFITSLEAITTIPVKRIDERLSTVSAAATLRSAGKSAKDSKHLIDSMAAVAILEAGLRYED
jgi:putative Holliday junction resolvase